MIDRKHIMKKIAFVLLIIFSSAFIALCMKHIVDSCSNLFASDQEIVIRMIDDNADGRALSIVATGSKNDCFNDLKEAVKNDPNWIYTEGTPGVSWTKLETTVFGAEVKIRTKANANKYVAFHKDNWNAKAQVFADGVTQTVDNFTIDGAQINYFKLFSNMNCTKKYKRRFYAIIIVMSFLFLTLIVRKLYNVKIFSSNTGKSVIYLYLLALLFVSCIKDNVNYVIVHYLLPKEDVTFITHQKTNMSIETGDFRNNLSSDNLLIGSEESTEGYVTTFHMTQVPEQFIRITINNEIDEIQYECNGVRFQYNITVNDRTNGYIKIYPFADSMKKVFVSLIIYILSSVLILIWLLLFNSYFASNEITSKVVQADYSYKYVFFGIVFVICFSMSMFQYTNHINLPYYMPDNATGDQSEYWNTYIFKDGKINTQMHLTTFRGYSGYLLSSIAKVVGSIFSVDPVKIYLIFPALAFAWLITIILPELFNNLMNRKPKIFAVLFYFIIFLFFWNEHLTLVATDLYNNVLFFSTITYGIRAYRKESSISAIISGISFAFMINMHFNFGIYMIVVILGFLVCMFIKYKLENKNIKVIDIIKKYVIITKKKVINLFLAITCFLVVSLPQVRINYNSGYIGLFPHDSEHAYYGRPVSWSMWNTFFSSGMILWPKFLGDNQTFSMKAQLYEQQSEVLHPAQAMDLYAESPVETAVTLIKKIFVMFDRKDNVNYGDNITWRETYGLLFSLFNYFVIILGLYILIKHQKISKSMKCLSWWIFFATVCMRLAGHVEQRGSMTFYILLLMYFSYIFIGEILTNKNEYVLFIKDSKPFKVVFWAEIFSFALSMALWG